MNVLINVLINVSYSICSTAFPEDDITAALENVFSFDSYDDQVKELIVNTFVQHGFPMDTSFMSRKGFCPRLICCLLLFVINCFDALVSFTVKKEKEIGEPISITMREG